MKQIGLAFLALLALVFLAGCNAGRSSEGTLGMAPPFTLLSLEGQERSLDEFRGKPILLHFWATWCPPCREEMPLFQKLYQELGPSGLVILGVNVGESPPEVREFIEGTGVTFPILLDTKGEVANRYGVRGLPTTFWIDPSGRIVDVTLGGPLPEDFILENLRKIGVGK